MTQPTRIKVPRGQRIVLDHPPLDSEEIASRRAQSRAFARAVPGYFSPSCSLKTASFAQHARSAMRIIQQALSK